MRQLVLLLVITIAGITFAQKNQNHYYFQYNYLSEWDNWGVPENLEAERDSLSEEFLDRIYSVLVPRCNLPQRHPELFEASAANKITLQQEADVYLTFVKETAGFRNTIGYYYYNPEEYPDTDKAVYFNGVDQYGRIPYYDALNTENLSAEFWVYPDEDQRFSVLRRHGAFSVYVAYNNVYVQVDGAQCISTSKLLNKAWNHVVVTIEKYSPYMSEVKIYINGQLNVETFLGKTLPTDNNSTITISWSGSYWYLKGGVDEIVLYNTILSEDQVIERYNDAQGIGTLPTGINLADEVIAWFDFNNIGETAYNKAPIGSGYDMILYNGATTMQGVLGHPPMSTLDLLNHGITIVFPNFSAERSGGGLVVGDKVKIGHFDAGTVIGWFIYANGYANQYVKNEYIGRRCFYSDDNFNFENESQYRRHWIMFRDNPSGKLIVGVEDINRPWGDNDFEDATMIVSASPSGAIDQSEIIGYGEPPANPKVDVSLAMSVSNTEPENEEEVTFQITATNDGPNNATELKIYDKLPDGLEYISHTASAGTYDTSTFIWSIDELSAGASATLNITARVSLTAMMESAFDIGVAKDYNVFIIDDMYQPSADAEGRVAVGREAVFDEFTIGYALRNNTDSSAVLVSGYNLTYISGNVYGGDVIYVHETNLPDENVGIINGEIRQDTLIDFEEAESYLLTLSNTLKEYQANGTTEMIYSQLSMTGTNPFLNIFDISGEDLSAATETVISVPNGAVVLVNIGGDNIDWSGGLVVSGTDITNVLYNFYEADSVTIHQIDVTGTILAPKAHVNFISGVQNGQMIAKCLEGTAQYNNVSFVGLIPTDSVLVNIAEVASVNEEDVDSEPGNGSESEDDYASVTLRFNSESAINNTGVEWELVGGSSDGTLIWVMTLDKDGYILSGNWGGGIYRSTDDGNSWVRINETMSVNYIWSLLVDGEKIYAGTDNGIYVSWDNGATWEQKLSGSLEIRAMVEYDGKIYAASWGGGVFVSEDNGETWNGLSDDILGIPFTSIAVAPDGSLLCGSFDSGIWKSGDGGASWSQREIDYRFVWSLLTDPYGNIYAGTYGNGVYSSTNNGETWEKDFGVTARYIYNFAIDVDSNIVANSWMSGIYIGRPAGGKGSMMWQSLGLGGMSVTTIMPGEAEGILYAATEDGSIYRTEDAVVGISSDNETLAKHFELKQNYPNPFNPVTTIKYSIPTNVGVETHGRASLRIYNVLGEEVATLVNQRQAPGNYSVQFNASNLPSGVYFYTLRVGDFVATKKMILLK